MSREVIPVTEAEWWGARDSWRTTEWLFKERAAGERKLRLVSGVCCRRLGHELGGKQYEQWIGMLEQLADGLIERKLLPDFLRWGYPGSGATGHEIGGPPSAEEWAEAACRAAFAPSPTLGAAVDMDSGRTFPGSVPLYVALATTFPDPTQVDAKLQDQVHLLHDIFGPLPFRDVLISPAWLTSDVIALARGIYDEKAFDRMPILADALQDAGCDNAEVLDHCRAANWEHVRGCWVIDLILGKPWRENS